MINLNNMPRAYSEVYAIINTLGMEYINKIPKKVYQAIEDSRDKNYSPEFSLDIEPSQGAISTEAVALITALNLQYWCNEQEKQEIKKSLIENEEKEREKLFDMFGKNKQIEKQANGVKSNEDTVEENTVDENKDVQMVQYKKISIFKKMFSWIKRKLKK